MVVVVAVVVVARVVVVVLVVDSERTQFVPSLVAEVYASLQKHRFCEHDALDPQFTFESHITKATVT